MPSNNVSRQTAKRVVPTELNAAHTVQQPGEEDQSPNYLVLPSGDGANRVLVAGVVTDVTDEGTDNEYLRMQATDITGESFFAYAGEYQKDAKAQMKDLDAPEFVSVVGKPRTFEKDDGQILVSIAPEDIQTISQREYYDILIETADNTIARLNGERGDTDPVHFPGIAGEIHTDETREDIYEATVESLEEVHDSVTEPEVADADTLSRDQLEQMDYNELQSLAAAAEGLNGNAPADDIIDGLEGEPVPA